MAQPEGSPKGITPSDAHVETVLDNMEGTITKEGNEHALFKSKFDNMSLSRTTWVFRRVVLIALAVYTGFVCEGFEVSEKPEQSPCAAPKPAGLTNRGGSANVLEYSLKSGTTLSPTRASSSNSVLKAVLAYGH